MIIDSVDVEGFWGNKKANAKFNQDVTIFIGLNGTVKTTFVNLIAAAISVDISQLSNPHSAGKNRKSCIFKEWEILKRQISEYRILTTVGSLPESVTK